MKRTLVKTEAEIKAMREGGKMLAEVLNELKLHVHPGVTTGQLDTLARKELLKRGGTPAFLNYNGFPASICISVNEGVVHGIPGRKVLHDQDVVKLDLGVRYKGLVTDAAITVLVGDTDANPDVQKLVEGTRLALAAGVSAARAGNRVGDIGAAIESVLDRYGLGIIEDLCGHGVGHSVHEEPSIPNYGRAGTGMRLEAGMTLAIEPMATLGGIEVVLAADGWTYFTEDHSLTAQFEHTIVVTEKGGDILTSV